MARFYHANHRQWSNIFDQNPVRIPIILRQLRTCKPAIVAGALSLLANDSYAMKISRFTAEFGAFVDAINPKGIAGLGPGRGSLAK